VGLLGASWQGAEMATKQDLQAPQLLTPEQVAQITGLSPVTLAQWRSQRRHMPYLKIGRVVRYDAAEVSRYLEGCRVSVSDPHERRQV